MYSDTAIESYINKCIREEKGNKITVNQKISDSDLDSLGIVIMLLSVDDRYKCFKHIPDTEDVFEVLDIENMTLKDLILLCK